MYLSGMTTKDYVFITPSPDTAPEVWGTIYERTPQGWAALGRTTAFSFWGHGGEVLEEPVRLTGLDDIDRALGEVAGEPT